MTNINFNPAAKTNQKQSGQIKDINQTNTSQERTQISWDKALPGSNIYTGQPIKVKTSLSNNVNTEKSFEVIPNGFLVKSKDGSPVKYETVPIQEDGKTLYKIIGNDLEIYATSNKDIIIVEGDQNTIFGGSESDKFYVKGNSNLINSDSSNWKISSDGKSIDVHQINKYADPKVPTTGYDRIFVYGKNNTVVTSDDTRKDVICTYEPGKELDSNAIDKQTDGKDYFYRFNDNYDPKNPVAVVFDSFDGPDSHGNAVRNTLLKGGHDRTYDRELKIKTFDFDMKENKWKTEFIDEERFSGAKKELEDLNNKEFPEGSRERFSIGLDILEQHNIVVDVINNSTDPNFFKAKADLNETFTYTYKELEGLLGSDVKLHAHNMDKHRNQILNNIETRLNTTQDPTEIKRLKEVKIFLENKPQFYATYQDLSNLINEHRGPNTKKISINDKNIDHYREELIQILDEDAKKPKSKQKTSWGDIQYIRDILAEGKYPFVNAAGNERSGIGMISLTNESITVSGKNHDYTYYSESQDMHQSSLVDAHEFVEKYGHRGTSISAPLHCRRYIENKAKLFNEMQKAETTYFK